MNKYLQALRAVFLHPAFKTQIILGRVLLMAWLLYCDRDCFELDLAFVVLLFFIFWRDLLPLIFLVVWTASHKFETHLTTFKI